MNRFITAGVTVRMQFYPATNFTHIFEQRNYRWILLDKTNRWVVYAERATSKMSRVSEKNYMLTIQGVRAEDEGAYRVDCWYGSINNVTWLRSNSVDLELQEPTSITTTLTPIDIVTATSKGIVYLAFLMVSIDLVSNILLAITTCSFLSYLSTYSISSSFDFDFSRHCVHLLCRHYVHLLCRHYVHLFMQTLCSPFMQTLCSPFMQTLC